MMDIKQLTDWLTELKLAEVLGIGGFILSIISLFFDPKRFLAKLFYKNEFAVDYDYAYNGSTGNEDIFFRITNTGNSQTILYNYVLYRRGKGFLKTLLYTLCVKVVAA